MITKNIDQPDCMYAMAVNDFSKFSELCQSVLNPDFSSNLIITFDEGKYYVSSTDKIWLQYCCDSDPEMIPACRHCVITLSCGCGLESAIFLYRRII